MKSCEEWKLAFDQYYNNITSNKAPGVESFEISRFLTDAQYAIVVGLYNGTLGVPFESTEQITEYLAPLIYQEECAPLDIEGFFAVSKDSKLFELPEDLLFVTLELCYLKDDSKCAVNGEKQAIVVPVTQDEYWKTVNDPFKKHNKRRVLRLSHGEVFPGDEILTPTRYSELISSEEITRYIVRYIKKPEPIVLEDYSRYGGISIDGYVEPRTCILPEALHQVILAEAVRLAKAVWQS